MQLELFADLYIVSLKVTVQGAGWMGFKTYNLLDVPVFSHLQLFDELLSISSHLKHYRRMYSENSRMVVVRQELTALIQLFPQVRTAAINPFLSYPGTVTNIIHNI